MAPPTIDTSVARSMYSVSSRRVNGSYLSPQETRVRSLSTASSSSTLSLVTPVPSSGNSSSSSLNLPSNFTSDPEQTPSSTAFASASEEEVYSDEEIQPDEFVLALHDFVPQQQNATCLAFRAGETIRVLNRDASGWWDGEIDGRRGWFPSNYVDKEVNSLMDEELPSARPRNVHSRAVSDASLASRASTASPMPEQRVSLDPDGRDVMFPAGTSNTPPLMIPLLHGLQLLQNTTLARRVSHYQPSVACIIQCIRALLQQTDCLARGAPPLKAFPILAQERKRVLAELALLVTQSKKASSSDHGSEEEREPDEEHMLRLAGQVFARVRRFLAVAVQCGVDVPERSFRSPAADTFEPENVSEYTSGGSEEPEGVQNQYGFNKDDEVYYPVTALNRSSDTEAQYASGDSCRTSVDSVTPLIPNGQGIRISRVGANASGHVVHHRYQGRNMSLSSSSSFSSFSSLESPSTPPAVPFPEGPCSAQHVQQALRATHDTLLSTIAAFIGHVHAHSRAAHASSTGHLFALVRQIVDIVCKLLTIVDAVMGVRDVPWIKLTALENAKEHLYQMACALADAVREMATGAGIPPSEEELERTRLLKVATDALKAGSDCVSAVKTCLVRPRNMPPYVIVFPSMSDNSTPPNASAAALDASHRHETPRQDYNEDHDQGQPAKHAAAPETLSELHKQVQMGYTRTTQRYEYDSEDVTIQPRVNGNTFAHAPVAEQSYENVTHTLSGAKPERDRQSFVSALNINMNLPSVPIEDAIEEEEEEEEVEEEEEEEEEEELDLPSPTVQASTDICSIDGETISEGSQRLEISLEDKLINGELPSIPQSGEGNIPLAWTLSHDYASQDVAYNSEGQLVGATLEALVEKMTPHDQIVDAAFSAVFFFTFRLFASPIDLAEAVSARFNLVQPSRLSETDMILWQRQKLLPVRLRVSNFLKLWLEAYWRVGYDDEALPFLQHFVRGTMSEILPPAAQRLDDLIVSRQMTPLSQPNSPISERQRLGERLRDAGMPVGPHFIGAAPSSSEVPRPVMTKALLAALRARSFASIPVTDFDVLELARQMTLLECSLYCLITAEEMLELGKPGAPPAVNVKAVSSLSTAITGWVSESILGEPDVKRRVLLVKFFIKVADRCTTLNNFSTPRSILAALDSSTISRLHQTWSGLAQKNKIQLEALRKLADHARNYHEYRSRLRNTAPPAVPFLGLYLTDLTFCREGNPSHRASPLAPEKKLLNFNKYHKLARIVQDMQRFQVPYNLKDIPEARQYLQFCLDKTKDLGDLDDLYRRSQLLEPKQAAETPTNGELKTSLFGWGGRSQSSSQTSQATIA